MLETRAFSLSPMPTIYLEWTAFFFVVQKESTRIYTYQILVLYGVLTRTFFDTWDSCFTGKPIWISPSPQIRLKIWMDPL